MADQSKKEQSKTVKKQRSKSLDWAIYFILALVTAFLMYVLITNHTAVEEFMRPKGTVFFT